VGGRAVVVWVVLSGRGRGVFACVVTLAVREGLRAELVETLLGANSHVEVFSQTYLNENERPSRVIPDYADWVDRIAAVPGVTRAAARIQGQVMASWRDANTGAQVFGLTLEDVQGLPRIADPSTGVGDLSQFDQGIAVGQEMARDLGVLVGDSIKLINPNGVRSALGVSPRVNVYEVVYIFASGRYDIDKTRIYMPFAEAQVFFNREGVADEVEVMVEEPEEIERYAAALTAAGGERALLWTWKDRAGGFLRALDVEDNVMFVILSILVLIAAMNIISGLIMLVKKKGSDIGILRTVGLTEGSILRIFFLCGAVVGIAGTLLGVIFGCLFAYYIDPIFSFVNWAMGGGVWDPSIRGIYALPAKLELWDVLSAMALSLGLSFVVTIFPARRAARMNPVEALRYE